MDYLISIIGFVAAIIAVRGNTWNEGAVGLSKITWTGRISIVLAIASLTAAIAIKYNENQTNKYKRNIAVTQLLTEYNDIKDVIRLSFDQLTLSEPVIRKSIPNLESTISIYSSYLSPEEVAATLSVIASGRGILLSQEKNPVGVALRTFSGSKIWKEFKTGIEEAQKLLCAGYIDSGIQLCTTGVANNSIQPTANASAD
jgi:hypothetical protein